MAQNDKPETEKPKRSRKPAAAKESQSTASKAPVRRQSTKAAKPAPEEAKAPAKPAKRKPVAKKATTSTAVDGKKADKPAKPATKRASKAKPATTRQKGASQAPAVQAKKTRTRKPVAPVVPDDDAIPGDDPFMGLTPREARFIDLWIACHNGTQAYRAAGYHAASDQIAAVCASQLLRKPKLQPYLRKRSAEFYAETEAQRDRLLGTILEASFADPRELSRYEYRCCRYCWDEQHRYQYTPAELTQARADYEKEKSGFLIVNPGVPYPEFDEQGGATFDGRRDANPDCPECFGDGRGRLILGDTRNLTPAAVAIYAGTEVGKDGIKVRIADQAKYRELLGKVVGLLDDDREVSLTVRASQEELDALYVEGRARAHAAREAMLERARQLAEEDAARGEA